MTPAAEIRAWTRANLRARLAYYAREAGLDGMCSTCWDRPRDGRHHLCWKCRAEARRKR